MNKPTRKEAEKIVRSLGYKVIKFDGNSIEISNGKQRAILQWVAQEKRLALVILG